MLSPLVRITVYSLRWRLLMSNSFSSEDFSRLLADTIDQLSSLSKLKGGEYCHGDDRLDNFRRNAAALGLPMEVIWSVYYAKHHDAVMTFCRDLQSGKARTRLEPIAGRVDDMIVYLILFKAMLVERGELRLEAPDPAPTPNPFVPSIALR